MVSAPVVVEELVCDVVLFLEAELDAQEWHVFWFAHGRLRHDESPISVVGSPWIGGSEIAVCRMLHL
jgi:hypothetical protein